MRARVSTQVFVSYENATSYLERAGTLASRISRDQGNHRRPLFSAGARRNPVFSGSGAS